MARFGSLGTQYFDSNGKPLSGGQVSFYESGTTTPKDTYTTSGFTVANTNPVILSSGGRQPSIFFGGVAKAILSDSNGVQIEVRDPVGDTASQFGDPWLATTVYAANEVVQGSDGEFYVSLVGNNVNQDPTATSGYWDFLYSIQYNSGTTYPEGAVVTVSGILYQSLQGSNLNHSPASSPTYWVLISLAYVSTITYTVGQNVVGPDGIFYTALRTTINDTPASSPSDWVGTSAAAATSATAAAASATAAAASASAASTSATASASSASTATTQASNASTSATSSASSATTATTQASNASTSAASALTYLQTFQGQYYGALATDPTVDPLGAPMTAGDLYFNTTSNEMRNYTGAAWVAVYLPASGYATSGANSNITSLSGLTTALSAPQGGTGQSSYAIGDILYASTTTALSKLADVATGNAIISGGISTAPSWGKIALTTHVSGTLPVANGGTGAATLTTNYVLLGNGTSALQMIAPSSSGNVLKSNGTTWTSAAPAASGISAGLSIALAMVMGF